MAGCTNLVCDIAITTVTGICCVTRFGAGGSSDVSGVTVRDYSNFITDIGITASTGIGGVAARSAGRSSDSSIVFVTGSLHFITNVGITASTGIGGVAVLSAGVGGYNSIILVTDSLHFIICIGIATIAGISGVTVLGTGGIGYGSFIAMGMRGNFRLGSSLRYSQIKVGRSRPAEFFDQTKLSSQCTGPGKRNFETGIFPTTVVTVEVKNIRNADIYMIGNGVSGFACLCNVQRGAGTADNQTHSCVIVIGAGRNSGNIGFAVFSECILVIALVEIQGTGEAQAVFSGFQEFCQSSHDTFGVSSGIEQRRGYRAAFTGIQIFAATGNRMGHHGSQRGGRNIAFGQRFGKSGIFAFCNGAVIDVTCCKCSEGDYSQEQRQTKDDRNKSFHWAPPDRSLFE